MSLRGARQCYEAILPLRRLLRPGACPEFVEGGLAMTNGDSELTLGINDLMKDNHADGDCELGGVASGVPWLRSDGYARG